MPDKVKVGVYKKYHKQCIIMENLRLNRKEKCCLKINKKRKIENCVNLQKGETDSTEETTKITDVIISYMWSLARKKGTISPRIHQFENYISKQQMFHHHHFHMTISFTSILNIFKFCEIIFIKYTK